MPTPQRLPIVNQDDAVWGDILRQYLMKEHYNDDTDNAANGGHNNITVRAGTAGSGGAPLKFTTGTLLTTPEAGAFEFAGDHFYATSTTGPTRKKLAIYDDTSSATGDIYYRDSSGYFTRLGAGSAGDFLTIASGIPSWTASIVGKVLDNTNTITVKDANFTLQDDSDITKQAKFQLSSIAAGTTRTYTLPDGDTTIVGTNTTQTLTSKTLTTPKIDSILDTANGLTAFTITGVASAANYVNITATTSGSSPVIQAAGSDANSSLRLNGKGTGRVILRDATDTTKQASFDMSGISTATNRVFTMPNANTTLVGTNTTDTLTGKTIVNGTSGNAITGLGIPALSAITGTPSSSTYLRGDGQWTSVSGGTTRTFTVTSGSYTAGSATNADYIYIISGVHAGTLPTANGNTSRYTFKNNYTASVTVTRDGTDTIEGSTSVTLAPESSIDLVSNGTNAWIII